MNRLSSHIATSKQVNHHLSYWISYFLPILWTTWTAVNTCLPKNDIKINERQTVASAQPTFLQVIWSFVWKAGSTPLHSTHPTPHPINYFENKLTVVYDFEYRIYISDYMRNCLIARCHAMLPWNTGPGP